MASPAEVVADAFSTAEAWAASAQSQLTLFTTALNDAIQVAPTLNVVWEPIMGPGGSNVGSYAPPADYTSTFIDLLCTKLTARINGGTGLSATVEAAIWDRARERELATRQANIDQATRDSESLGWALPPGVLVDAVARETRGYHDGAATFSRDVAIKQAELEQANLQKVYDQAIAYESMLADIRSKRAQVALDTFRAGVEAFVAQVTQDVKYWEVQIKQYEGIQNYTLQAGRINSEIVRANMSASLDAAKTGAQVFAQLTAAAYGLINASASVSGSSSMSVGYSYSNDTAGAAPTITSI